MVYGIRKPRGFGGCITVACLAVTILGACLIATMVEGLVCLFMVIPLAFPLAAFGAACAYAIQRRRCPCTPIQPHPDWIGAHHAVDAP